MKHLLKNIKESCNKGEKQGEDDLLLLNKVKKTFTFEKYKKFTLAF